MTPITWADFAPLNSVFLNLHLQEIKEMQDRLSAAERERDEAREAAYAEARLAEIVTKGLIKERDEAQAHYARVREWGEGLMREMQELRAEKERMDIAAGVYSMQVGSLLDIVGYLYGNDGTEFTQEIEDALNASDVPALERAIHPRMKRAGYSTTGSSTGSGTMPSRPAST
jgi:hypothetical protein